MSKRLTKIYTRTGDDGSTGMADGSRVQKDAIVIAAIGDLDELNGNIGVILAQSLPDELNDLLITIQHDLFNIGGELSYPAFSKVDASSVLWLEQKLDAFNADLPALKDFILPSGGSAAAHCHVARAVCRRAERSLVTWVQQCPEVNPSLLVYLNRLSDLLFVLCRVLARAAGETETLWQSGRESK